jgi:DASS family divalent anion:Na+ symporter
VSISWLDWALGASLPGLLCLAVIPLAMLKLAPPEILETPSAADLARRELTAMGPFSRDELVMAIIFVGLILLWILGGFIGIGASQAAAIGVVVMLLFGVLTWEDALREKAAWDTMIWIGLLVVLASKLNEYGLVEWFGGTIEQSLGGLTALSAFVVVSAVYLYVHYFFASAAAHISALFPVAFALIVAAGFPPLSAAIALGALSNVMGCLTQYAIGSAPVMFGAGYVSQAEWWRTGFVMSLVYLGIWLVVGPVWWSALGLGG